MKFSQRYGYTPSVNPFLHETISEELRVELWNFLAANIWDSEKFANREASEIAKMIWIIHLHRDADKLPLEAYESATRARRRAMMKMHLMTCKWYEVYDLLEFLAQRIRLRGNIPFPDAVNRYLERHNSAYRFAGDRIVELTDGEQIAAVQDAQQVDVDAARTHIRTAIDLFSSRTQPDFRNSVKESISAVEAMCQAVADMPGATLGNAIKRIPDLHPAFKEALSKLYGFTSDAAGIRHAISDKQEITKEDAKLMLVLCSAFVAYLRVHSSQP